MEKLINVTGQNSIRVGDLTNKGRVTHEERTVISGKQWYCLTESGGSFEMGGIFLESELTVIKSKE